MVNISKLPTAFDLHEVVDIATTILKSSFYSNDKVYKHRCAVLFSLRYIHSLGLLV